MACQYAMALSSFSLFGYLSWLGGRRGTGVLNWSSLRALSSSRFDMSAEKAMGI